MEEPTLTIGDLAAAVGVNASAVRYYERRGLMPVPERVGGQRRYGAAAEARLRTIRAAQQVGLSLNEVAQVLAATENGKDTAALRDLAERKLQEIEALIERAEAIKQWLELAVECRSASLDACGLFAPDDLASETRITVSAMPFSHRQPSSSLRTPATSTSARLREP